MDAFTAALSSAVCIDMFQAHSNGGSGKTAVHAKSSKRDHGPKPRSNVMKRKMFLWLLKKQPSKPRIHSSEPAAMPQPVGLFRV